MKKNRSSVSQESEYKKVGEFWDSHDLSEFWDKTEAADFAVNIESEIIYYAVERDLSDKVEALAQKRGVTADTLINLWVQEKLQERKA